MSTVGGGGPVPALRRLFPPVILGSAQASIAFSGIPGGYSALLLVASLRGDAAATNIGVSLQFNGDAGTNYAFENFYANGGVSSEAGTISASSLFVGGATAAGAPAGAFGLIEATVPFYAGTVAQKGVVARAASRLDATASGVYTHRPAGFWLNTAAIAQVTVLPTSGNFVAGSAAVLYGML